MDLVEHLLRGYWGCTILVRTNSPLGEAELRAPCTDLNADRPLWKVASAPKCLLTPHNHIGEQRSSTQTVDMCLYQEGCLWNLYFKGLFPCSQRKYFENNLSPENTPLVTSRDSSDWLEEPASIDKAQAFKSGLIFETHFRIGQYASSKTLLRMLQKTTVFSLPRMFTSRSQVSTLNLSS